MQFHDSAAAEYSLMVPNGLQGATSTLLLQFIRPASLIGTTRALTIMITAT